MITLKTDLDLFLQRFVPISEEKISERNLIGLPLVDEDGNRIGQVIRVDYKYRYVYFIVDRDRYFEGVNPVVSMSFSTNKE